MFFFKSNKRSLESLLDQSKFGTTSEYDVQEFVDETSKEIVSLWNGFIKNKQNVSVNNIANDIQENETSDIGVLEQYSNEQTNKNNNEQVVEKTIVVSNAQAGEIYSETIQIPDELINNMEIGSSHQFDELSFDEDTSELRALTSEEGEAEIILEYTTKKRVKLKLYVNEDPKNMWKDIPSSEDVKPDNESHFIENDDHMVISASRRGRSHANRGTHRDDHVLSDFYNNWTIAIVADGAGYAKLSSLGSKVACDSIMECLKQNLELKGDVLVSLLVSTNDEGNKPNAKVKTILYEILVDAAHKGMKAMYEKAREINKPVKDLSTTLSIVVVRKFEFGKFVATYQVGDGAIAAYDSAKIDLLCTLDKGEHKNQTLFLNSHSIFKSSKSLMNRIFYKIYEQKNNVLLMTDGIVDPYFDGDEERLMTLTQWEVLWNALSESVLSKKEPEKNLLEWLNFYIAGEHDDRTMTIIIDK